MLAFPSMLKGPAQKADISTPDDPEKFDEYKELYPHFYAFCVMQLGQPMPYPGVHWDNAHVIASIPEDQILNITPQEIIDKGFQIGFSDSVSTIDEPVEKTKSWKSKLRTYMATFGAGAFVFALCGVSVIGILAACLFSVTMFYAAKSLEAEPTTQEEVDTWFNVSEVFNDTL